MPKILREPLLHFFILGVAIFAAYEWLSDGTPADGEIVVTRGQQQNLIQTFERTWRRPPTTSELNGLVEDYVREEIAYREAGAMELDRNDIVIRRRLRQKLELLTEDLAALSPPTDDELEAYYAANAERFRTEARYSFEQIYFSVARGDEPERSATELLGGIANGSITADPAELGDRSTLPTGMVGARHQEVASTFGSQFAEGLRALPVGEWSGPVASGFGVHVVRLSERVEGEVPPLTDIAVDARNGLLAERRRKAVDALYEALGERYTIRVEPFTANATEE